MVKLTEIFIRKGTAARPGRAMSPKFITIHNTANTGKGAGARSHASYMTVNGGQNKSAGGQPALYSGSKLTVAAAIRPPPARPTSATGPA